MGGKKKYGKSHKKALETMANNPSLINLSNIFMVEIEVPFKKIENPSEIDTEVDLILTGKNIYVVEYKLEDSFNKRYKALQQLEKAKECLRHYRGIKDLNLLYVHNNFIVHQLIDGNFSPFP